MSKCQECGSDCNERDELTKAEREIERLQARLGGDVHTALEADAETDAYKRLRIAATNVVTAFEQLGKAQHAPELLIARSRCETVMVKLNEALKA